MRKRGGNEVYLKFLLHLALFGNASPLVIFWEAMPRYSEKNLEDVGK